MNTQDIAAYMNDSTGYVMLVYNRLEDAYKIPIVVFASKDKGLLEDIQTTLSPIKGCIVTRANGAYNLHYTYNAALDVCAQLQNHVTHSAKRARINLLLSTYKSVTPRNGKYSPELRLAKIQFQKDFEAL